MEELRKKINDSALVRWIVLVIVATAMMMGYFLNDIMSPWLFLWLRWTYQCFPTDAVFQWAHT